MEPPNAITKAEPSRPQNERAPTPSSLTATFGPKKDVSVKSGEDDARKDHAPAATPTTSVQQVTTTKSGRASKPSTPAVGTFPDGLPNNNGRARPARNSEAPTIPKRSHKKGASQAHAAAMLKLQQQKANGGGGGGGETNTNAHEDDMEVDDPDEPTYCYCNRVSFGEMVGCDGGECKREWFHLECVGLRNAPPKNSELPRPCSFDFYTPSGAQSGGPASRQATTSDNTPELTFSLGKWFCDDCKKINAAAKKVSR